MLVLSLTSTHTPAAWMILGFPFLILFPALATSNQRYWGISAKRRSCWPQATLSGFTVRSISPPAFRSAMRRS
jgi:hypothetical protein